LDRFRNHWGKNGIMLPRSIPEVQPAQYPGLRKYEQDQIRDNELAGRRRSFHLG
jgi:hypothetical protein